MYTIRRVSTVPASPLRVLVSGPAEQGADGKVTQANLATGGSFTFYPAGSEEGESAFGVDEYTARVLMEDPGMAPHFDCSPALPGTAAEPQAEPAAPAVPEAAGKRRRRQAEGNSGVGD